MKKSFALGALLAALAFGHAFAQATAPTVVPIPSTSQTDLMPIIPKGNVTAQSHFATLPQVNGASGYHNGGVASTAWSYTFKPGEQYFFIQPSGTLATGALTTEANPGDGQRECFFSTQTQTAITWTANTTLFTQVIDGSAPTAGVADTLQCLIFSTATSTWYQIQ